MPSEERQVVSIFGDQHLSDARHSTANRAYVANTGMILRPRARTYQGAASTLHSPPFPYVPIVLAAASRRWNWTERSGPHLPQAWAFSCWHLIAARKGVTDDKDS
jgi:hypothetical protein